MVSLWCTSQIIKSAVCRILETGAGKDTVGFVMYLKGLSAPTGYEFKDKLCVCVMC